MGFLEVNEGDPGENHQSLYILSDWTSYSRRASPKIIFTRSSKAGREVSTQALFSG